MKYMIIERFKIGKVKAVYERFDKHGRLLPNGVYYLDSWIDERVATCYQLMEANSKAKLLEWIEQWKDLADFEIVPVISSEEAKRKVFAKKKGEEF